MKLYTLTLNSPTPIQSGVYVGTAQHVLSLGTVPDDTAQIPFARRLSVVNNHIFTAGVELHGGSYQLTNPVGQQGFLIRVIPSGTPRPGSRGYCEAVTNIFGEDGQSILPFLLAQGRIDRGAANGVSHCIDALYYMPPESALMIRQEGQSFVTHVLKAFVDLQGEVFPLLQVIAPLA